MSRRRIAPEELELWQRVARSAQRLAPERVDRPSPLDKPRQEPLLQSRKIPVPIDFEVGRTAGRTPPVHDVLPGIADRVAAAPVIMDKKAFQRLKRGRLLPEARIDLHGMTLDRAQPALTGFVLRAHAAGLRLVLVVTGKGKDRDTGGPIPLRQGVLRHAVPQWLGLPPLAGLILQITEAHQKHGGGGAYYVYLRRQR